MESEQKQKNFGPQKEARGNKPYVRNDKNADVISDNIENFRDMRIEKDSNSKGTHVQSN